MVEMDPTTQNPDGRRSESLRRLGRNVAAAIRRANHSPSLVAGLRRARKRLPGDSRFGDPLSTTASYRHIEALGRRLGLPTTDHGVLGEAGFGALQVGQWLLEAFGYGRGDRQLTIVFTDLVDFSSWALNVGDAETLGLLRDVGEALEPPIIDHGGEVVKHLGDGMMAVFGDAQGALEAVCEGRDRVAQLTSDGYRPRMRWPAHRQATSPGRGLPGRRRQYRCPPDRTGRS